MNSAYYAYIVGECLGFLSLPIIILCALYKYREMFFHLGNAFHVFAHVLACRILGVEVYQANYYRRLDEKSYCIEHKQVDSRSKVLFIIYAPLIFNLMVCVLLCFPFFMNYIGSYGYDLLRTDLQYLIFFSCCVGFIIGIQWFPTRFELLALDRQPNELVDSKQLEYKWWEPIICSLCLLSFLNLIIIKIVLRFF